jgi:hypothetical protein
MENGMTKIAELPMNGGGGNLQQPDAQSLPTISVSEMRRKNDSNVQTNYSAINMHPNPYGIPEQNNVMQNPENQRMEKQNIEMEMFQNNNQQVGTGLPDKYRNQIDSMPAQRLPSRDIPINSIHLDIDEEVQPNYIPRPTKKKDYVRSRSNEFENELYEYEQQKYRENQLDNLLDNVQIPIFIGLLFFIFQLPIVNTMIFKKFSFLSIYNEDGNFNVYGLILKSSLFGSFYMFSKQIISFISSI